MYRTIILVFVILAGLSVGSSCIDNCRGDKRQYVDVRGLTASPVTRPDTSWLINDQFYPVDSTSAVAANTFGIELFATVSYYAFSEVQINSFGAAFACSPAEPGRSGSQEIISDITITSNADFDSGHPAGSSLNDYFRISNAYDPSPNTNDSLYFKAIPLSDFLANQSKAMQRFQLWTIKRPESSLEHRFTIKYTQTNGEEYIAEAPKVIFQ